MSTALRMAAYPSETVRARKDKNKSVEENIIPLDDDPPQPKKDPRPRKRQMKVVGPKIDRPRPRRFGFPLMLFWLQQVVRLVPLLWGVEYHFTNPKRTTMDVLQQNYAFLKERLKDLSEIRSRTITVINSKGGAGKSPTIAYLAALYQKISGSWNILLDLNQNYGTVARLLGLRQSDTLSLRDAIPLGEQLKTKDDFKRHVRSHRQTGLRVVSSADMDAEDDVFTKDQVIDLHDKAYTIFDSVFQDTGNGMSHSSNLAAVETADALVFPAMWDNDDAIFGIQETLDGYFKRGFDQKIRDHGYHVIIGSAPNWKKDDVFRKYCYRIFEAYSAAHKGKKPEEMSPEELNDKVSKLMLVLGISIDRFFMVPFSRYIGAKKVVNTTRLRMGLATKVGYLQVLVAIYQAEIATDHKVEENGIEFDDMLAELFAQYSTEPIFEEEK